MKTGIRRGFAALLLGAMPFEINQIALLLKTKPSRVYIAKWDGNRWSVWHSGDKSSFNTPRFLQAVLVAMIFMPAKFSPRLKNAAGTAKG